MLSVKWAKKPMSILDLLSVAPFYVIMAMSPAQGQGEGSPSVRFFARLRACSYIRVDTCAHFEWLLTCMDSLAHWQIVCLQVFRVMRLMRIVSVLRVERTVTAWRLVVTVFKRKGDELMVSI
jgi:hypothetical protein